jgi:hypothetical protein
MNFPRTVIGYHGCLEPLATDLLSGKKSLEDWPTSKNKWDWLGEGIYFWEHGPHRALRWAEKRAKQARAKGRHARPAVVGAIILLRDNVLDLTDIHFAPMLARSYEVLAERFDAVGVKLPENEESDRKRHNLDCLVINTLFKVRDIRDRYSVVRGAFEEGDRVFPGSMIKEQTHIQLAVRDPGVICGLFRPARIVSRF